jgi:hypothetical protein
VNVCVEGPILDAQPPEPDADAQPEPEPDLGDAEVPDAARVRDRDGDGYADATDNCPRIANDQADADGDGQGDACDDDRDGDGIANVNDSCPDVHDPDQRDRNDNGEGDACEVRCEVAGAACALKKVVCSIRDACGAGYTLYEYPGVCDGARCGGFAPEAVQVEENVCGSMAICQPGPVEPCMPVEVCPSDLTCTPERDGARCRIAVEPERAARCVNARCQAWDCMTPACNALGPSRFNPSTNLGFERFDQDDPRLRVWTDVLHLHWAFVERETHLDEPAPPSASLADAHARCTALEYDGHTDWRLPTVYEMNGLTATINIGQAPLLATLTNTSALYFSRTVVGPDRVIGVSLVDGVLSPIPVNSAAQVVCVRDDGPPVAWDLTLRRAAFEDWRAVGEVTDPHTGLLWAQMPGQAVFEDAEDMCETFGAVVPTHNDLVSLMTFHTGPGEPTPSVWLEWNGIDFGASALRAWSRTPSPVDGERLFVDFEFGFVVAAPLTALRDVLCVRYPE